MNQSNIDYLYHVFTPAPDRPANTSRGESIAPAFGEHLNQVSPSVFEAVPKPHRDTQRSVASSPPDHGNSDRYDSPLTSPDDASAGTRSSASGNGDTSSDPSCAAGEDTGAAIDASKKSDADDRDDDEPVENEVVAGVTAASDAKSSPTSPAEAKPHKERAKGEMEIAPKAPVAEAAETPTAAATEDGEQGVPAVDIVPAAPVEMAAVTSEHGQPTNGQPANGEPATEHNEKNVKHSGTTTTTHNTHKANADEGTKELTSTNGIVEPAAKPAAEATATVDQQAVATEAPKGSEATRRTSATRRETDEDGSSRDGKKSVDAATAKGPGAGNVTTSVVAAVVSVPAETNSKLASAVEKPSDGDGANTKAVGNNSESALGPLGRTLRSAVEMTRGHKSTNASEAPQLDPARFIGRVTRAIHTANERGGALQLRLAPPELGSLKIELNIKDGVMSAALEADNATARRLLLDHLPALRERLAEQNIRVDRFDVDVRQDDTSGQANPRGSNHNPYQQHSEHEPQPRRNSTAMNIGEQTEPEPSVVATRISSTAINLVI